jgi:MurNAc alpha-1-phosphate uridylyltransferase
MRGMILAAGLGTRLRPLTDSIPKALVKIGDTSLLEFAIRKLLHYGFTDIIINIHHFPDLIIRFLNENKNFGASITISDEREMLLDTGGAVKKASIFLKGNEPILLYNCDIITDLNLMTFYEYHFKHGAMCTLAISERETSRCFLFDNDNNLCGWWNKKTSERRLAVRTGKHLNEKAFSGISIINPQALEFFPEKRVFSLVDFYLMIAAINTIKGYEHSGTNWADIGNPAALQKIQTRDQLLSYL